MSDTLFHEIVKTSKGVEFLRQKLETLINSQYWPKYLYTAKVIPLSKTDNAFVTQKNIRIISILPAITKLMESLILNKMKE